MSQKLTTAAFIERAREVHGDRYDYSKVEYVNMNTKLCIVCPTHGEFWQSSFKHLSGQGCEKCSRAIRAKLYSLGDIKFTEKAIKVHKGFYDYSSVKYINSHTKVQIKCPIHGLFLQDPASHLKGHGCPKCANIENGIRKRKWTDETCLEEAKNYKTRTEFQKANLGAYLYARKKELLDSCKWFEEKKKPNGYWSRERCEEESRKYNSKKEFVKGCPAAHHAAVVNGWLDSFYWLIGQKIDIINDKIDSVYAYVFEDTKTAYVGRTLIRRQKKRDKEHLFNQDSDSVARYAKKHHVPVPPMTIIETNLTLKEGQEREDFWRKWYEQKGYTMLNRSATGVGKGSIGAIGQGKWNRRTCEEEARKYNSASEFETKSSGAYAAALRHGWLKDYVWFAILKNNWDKRTCFLEAQKYNTRGEFSKGCFGAYNKALKEGWIRDYFWLKSRQSKPAGYWDNYDHCYEEAQKYRNIRAFQKGCSGAYSKAYKNGWIDDYNWFEANKKENGYWNRRTCYEEAMKYHSRSEFGKHAVRAYELSLANGWINDYTWFDKLTGFWTYDKCKAEAAKYKMRSHFKASCPSAYSKARKKGWLDEFYPLSNKK